jgi:hypothetical protein
MSSQPTPIFSRPSGASTQRIQPSRPSRPALRPEPVGARVPLAYFGLWALMIGIAMYFAAIVLSIVRLIMLQPQLFVGFIAKLLWISGFPSTVGIVLILIDLGVYFPKGRKRTRGVARELSAEPMVTVALTAYNDELSIASAVQDFLAHPRVKRVIVVSNNSRDRTIDRAREAGAIAINEEQQGYGRCVHRCLMEVARWEDTELVALCEGDMTFRAADLDKFLAYIPHSEIVNGTRIVEQLRDYDTQLTTFMYYGNFFAGKLLEAKHLGKGTFTDVGTTYKVMRRESVPAILQLVEPSVNLEFNAHFLDTALRYGFSIVECPVTFHPRVGVSKGGNVNNLRAMKVGLRMIWGLTFGWGLLS